MARKGKTKKPKGPVIHPRRARPTDQPTSPEAAAAVAKGLLTLGAPKGAKAALAYGIDAPVEAAVQTALAPREMINAEVLEATVGDFDLIVVGDGLASAVLAETKQQIDVLADRLAPKGRMAVWLATFAAPLLHGAPAAAHDAVIFPEAAGAGDLGEGAKAAVLSASGWMMLFRSAGLTCVAQAGVGESVLPEAVIAAHGVRLAVFDPQELNTGRFLAVFERGDAA